MPVHIVEGALGMVRGTVLESGVLQPLKGWRVVLSQSISGRSVPPLATMSSVDGTFSFPGVAKGAVTLQATKADVQTGSSAATGQIEREGQVIEVPVLVSIIRPSFGSIDGLVLDSNGAAGANAIVALCTSVCVDSATADADGRFALAQLPLGRYVVQARSQTTKAAGQSIVQIQVDGDSPAVTVVMASAGRINIVVTKANGTLAPNVRVTLTAIPGTGCLNNSPCVAYTNENGAYSFADVPATRFMVQAFDPVSEFKGAVGDTLDPPETKNVQIVLEPTASLRARVLLQNGTPAGGVVADLAIAQKHLFTQSAADGSVVFDTTPLGIFTLNLEDPLGSGVQRKTGTVTDPIDLGDIQLDETPPGVATVIRRLARFASRSSR